MLTLEQQLIDEIYYDLKIKGHLYLWQWKLVFQIAELSRKDQDVLIDFYCLDYEEPPIQDAKLKMQTYDKKKRGLIEMAIGDLLQVEPAKLMGAFAVYNDAVKNLDFIVLNTTEPRIKSILATGGIEYTLPERPQPPAPSIKPLSREIKNRAPHQKQLTLLENALGIVPLNRVITLEGWQRIIPIIELDDKQVQIFKAYYGINGLAKFPSEIVVEIPDITKKDIEKVKARVTMRLKQAPIKKMITLCLDANSKPELLATKIDQEIFRYEHSKQLNFIKNIMDFEDVKILTIKQWELFMKVFDLKNEYCDTIIVFFGVYSGKEMSRDLVAKELEVDINEVYLNIQKLKSMFHQGGVQNNFIKAKAQRLINAFWQEDEQVITYYTKLAENISKYKRQIAFLQKVTGNDSIAEPLSPIYWQEIMEALRWSEETRYFFKRYFSIDGEGEMTIPEIAWQDGNENNLAPYKRIKDTAYRNLFDRHVNDVKEALNNYYDGLPFDSSNIGRADQKTLLKSLSGKENVRVLSKEQWDVIFDAMNLLPANRMAFYYFYGVNGFGGGMTPKEMAEHFIEESKRQGKTTIEFENRTIEFDRATAAFNNLVHIPYLNLRKGNNPQIITEILEIGEANTTTLINKKQLDFLRLITGIKEVIPLTPDQWFSVMEQSGFLPIRRKMFSLRFGLLDGEEKSLTRVSEILNKDFHIISYYYYTLTQKLKKEENIKLINQYMNMNHGNNLVTYIGSPIIEDENIIKHQNQLEFIIKVTENNQITKPLPPEVWQEIMIGLKWTEEMRNYFTRFFGINGDEEMSKQEIAQQDGKTEAYYTQLRGGAYALVRKNAESLREEINNYYNGLPFKGYNIGRLKQKKLLSALVGQQVNHNLSYAEWEKIFNSLPMNPYFRVLFYLAYGVEGYGGGMESRELADLLVKRAIEKEETFIKLGSKVIDFESAPTIMKYSLHNVYSHLVKDSTRFMIAEMFSINEEPELLAKKPPNF